MRNGMTAEVAWQIGRLYGEGTVAGMSDGQLLDRFVSRHDEVAFAALVSRHGPLVMGVCCGILRDPSLAEDAFQAVFLVLARRACTIRRQESLAGWIYRVTFRIAHRALRDKRRHAVRETPALDAELAEPIDIRPGPDTESARRELQAMIHQELARLPERERTPIVLCDLQGLSHEEAARRLSWPIGTVKGRQSRGRERLRARLSRRGVTSPAFMTGGGLAYGTVRAAVPNSLQDATVWAALSLTATDGTTAVATGMTSASSQSLANGVVWAMRMSTWRIALLGIILVAGTVGGGMGFSVDSGASGGGDLSPPESKIQRIAEIGPKNPLPDKAHPSPMVRHLGERNGTHDRLLVMRREKSSDDDSLGVSTHNDETLTGDAARLQGVWYRTTSLLSQGKTQTFEAGQQPPLVVIGNAFYFGGHDETPIEAVCTGDPEVFTLDEATNPKRIRLQPNRRASKLGTGGLEGVYRLDGDILTLALGRAATPATSFEPNGKGLFVDTYQRAPIIEEPEADDPVIPATEPSRARPPDQLEVEPGSEDRPGDPEIRPVEPARELARREAEIELLRIEVESDKEAIRELAARLRRLDAWQSREKPPNSQLTDAEWDAFESRRLAQQSRELEARLEVFKDRFRKQSEILGVEERQLASERAEAGHVGQGLTRGGDIELAPPHRMRPGDALMIEVLEALPGRPICGERVVRSDGTISLPFYGELLVAGLTRNEVKVNVIELLRAKLSDQVLGLVELDPETGVEVRRIPPVESDRVHVEESIGDPRFLDGDTRLLEEVERLRRRIEALERQMP